MSRPSQFILNTDFPTLKNDGAGTADVVVPSAISVPGSGTASYSADIDIGVQGSISRSMFKSTVTDTDWHAGTQREFVRTGTESGFPVPYSLYAFTYRLNPTTIRCQVFIANPYAGTLTGAAGETISFIVKTFIPPFA